MNLKLIEENPNKHNLTLNKIKNLRILDWNKLKQLTWYNAAKKQTGTWWCHLEGSNLPNNTCFDDEDEFWIGFREEDNKIDFYFSCYSGMCSYKFSEFYKLSEIENSYDLNVQVNTIAWLNKLIDEGVLAVTGN